MDIRDLSIGDFVQARMVKWDYKDLDITPPMRVVRIDKDCVRLGFSLDDLEFEVFVDDLQPIPITAEILEKNGFVDNGKGQHYLKCGNGITVRVGHSPLFHDGCWLVATDKEVGETISTTCVLFNAKHIHEIQRVMRLENVGRERAMDIGKSLPRLYLTAWQISS